MPPRANGRRPVATETADVEYFERIVMEVDLGWLSAPWEPPPGTRLVPWSRDRIDAHAEVMARSFDGADDARLFRRLGFKQGCQAVMKEIAQHLAFSKGATWTIEDADGPIGCIQGVRRDWKIGAIQNIAVVPERQGQGVGTALISAACHGFRREGLRFAVLEVTADNEPAVGLYRRMGFAARRRFLRAAEVRRSE
jgi:ribosomal protein S18 acetylase RimI-like enzyme